jgi:hypothetical protein
MTERETYLDDGLYALFDGFMMTCARRGRMASV